MYYLFNAKFAKGNYPPLQTNRFKGALEFPAKFYSVFYPQEKRAAGFVNIEHDGTSVTFCEWNEEAYQAWCEAHPEPDYLDEAKTARIAKSKADLADYLASHPLQWTDGQYYAITAQRQAQLTSTLVCAQADGEPPEWNSTGGVCRKWDMQELTALSVAIKNRVKALVKYQQTQEVALRNTSTMEALNAIVVDYDSVT